MNVEQATTLTARLLKHALGGLAQFDSRQLTNGVSILIPVWNHEALLGRSVGSALRAIGCLREHGIPGQVLVIDDDSRDGSLPLLRQLEALHYQDGLRVLSMDTNVGQGLARNIALSLSPFRYFVCLDADNEIHSENLYEFYRSIRDTGAACVYGNLFGFEFGNDKPQLMINNESFQNRMFIKNMIDISALFDAQQVIELGGYAIENPVEDWELFMRLAVNGQLIVFVPLVFGSYYFVPGSWFSTLNEQERTGVQSQMHRVFDQFKLRQHQLIRTRHLRYHPDLGYI